MTTAPLSFLDRRLPAGVARRVHTVPAGGRLVCAGPRWETVLLVLERGDLLVQAPHGGTLRLGTGALFSLRGLVPAVLLPTGTDPAVLTSVGRRDEGEPS